MNSRHLIAVLDTLGEKIENQQATSEEEYAQLSERITELEEELRELKDSKKEQDSQLSFYKAESIRLAGELARLKTAAQELKVMEAQPKAEAFMKEKGQNNLMEGGKVNMIDNVKEVRLLTGWGLKETKEWIEEWLRKNSFHFDTNKYGWMKKHSNLWDREPIQT